jgi:hypothetical protein
MACDSKVSACLWLSVPAAVAEAPAKGSADFVLEALPHESEIWLGF